MGPQNWKLGIVKNIYPITVGQKLFKPQKLNYQQNYKGKKYV